MRLIALLLLVLATFNIAFSQEEQQQLPHVSILETNTPQGSCKGKSATIGDTVSLLYTGKFEDGTVFDASSLHGNQPFNFTIGERKVIPGMEIGCVSICENEKRTFRIPYQLAYGEQGIENAIPPKADLIFEVEVLSIESGPAQPFYMSLIPSFGTIGAFAMLGGFVFLVKFIIKKYPDETNSKKPAAGKPKKTKTAKQN